MIESDADPSLESMAAHGLLSIPSKTPAEVKRVDLWLRELEAKNPESPPLKIMRGRVNLAMGDVKEIVGALNHAAPYLSHELGRRITMKFTPSLKFELDQVFDEAQHIETLLHQPHVARDLGHNDADDGA